MRGFSEWAWPSSRPLSHPIKILLEPRGLRVAPEVGWRGGEICRSLRFRCQASEAFSEGG